MYCHGQFINQAGDLIEVRILTRADRSREVEIGAEGSGMYFAAESAVEITNDVNDTFDALLRQSATVRLLCREFERDFFCPSCRDAVVNVLRQGQVIFAGFIEPQTYSQPYNELLDEVELNCIDALSALQYSKWRDVGAAGVSYEAVKANAAQLTFRQVLDMTAGTVASALAIGDGASPRFLYDGSREVTKGAAADIFAGISIPELLFLGDTEDDVWTQEDALAEVFRYLNLHIAQDGLTFRIFAWDSLRSAAAIEWTDLATGKPAAAQARRTVEITPALAADTDAQITVGETFNQLLLTCNVADMENVIESPLDSDALTSPAAGRQLYCTEYSVDEGDGDNEWRVFDQMLDSGKTYNGLKGFTTNAPASVNQWYLRVMQHPSWTFPVAGTLGTDMVTEQMRNGKGQHEVANWISRNIGAAILSLGKVQPNLTGTDNSPVSSIDMEDTLCIGVNGNGKDDDTAQPTDLQIRNAIPVAVYQGNKAGGSFSPPDDASRNYIVISGTLVMNPIVGRASYNDAFNGSIAPLPQYWFATSRNGEGGLRLYARQYWTARKPSDTPQWDSKIGRTEGFQPYSGEGPEEYEYKYSSQGNGSDKTSRLPVLACMMVIGGKCLREKAKGEGGFLPGEVAGTGEGQVSDFYWATFKERSQCKDDDEYFSQCFYIGIDPKIGDKIIGVEHEIQTNFDYTLGIDADKGTAIPITKADALTGSVRFMILGPVNSMWDDITRRHKTWFRREKWTQNSIPLLSHVSNIQIKDFEVKLYSDSGQFDTGQSNDIIYMSDTGEDFTNPKDDLEFRICSALTRSERQELGVTGGPKLSTPANALTGEAIATIYDRFTAEQAKAEQLYVDSYWRELHEPRLLLEQSITDTAATPASRLDRYRHPAAAKDFFVQGISRNLMEGTARLTLKEIWD